MKVPVYNPEIERGDSVWCPAIIPERDHDLGREGKIADSDLVRRGGEWFVHLVVKRQHELQDAYDDLLALSRDEESLAEMGRVELGSLIAGCWGTVATAEATLTNDVDRTIHGDDRRLRHLFENLFRNAVEHGGDIPWE